MRNAPRTHLKNGNTSRQITRTSNALRLLAEVLFRQVFFAGRTWLFVQLYPPRLAINPQIYLDKGCSTININAGYAGGAASHQGEYAALNWQNRSVFLGPEYLQDTATGGKPWREFNLEDGRKAAQYATNRANKYGVVTSGAQEGRFDNDQWAQLTYTQNGSVSAYKNLSQAWGEVMLANPGMTYFGCYDGIIYLQMGDSKDSFRNALSSNQNAFNYMVQHSYQPNPYFSEGLYNFHPPLLNLYYRSSTDPLTKYAEVRLAIKLTQMALAHSQLLRSRRASGNTAWTTINSGSLVDFWENREAVVDGARNGNYGWIKISDYNHAVAPYDREVDVGSGQTVLCEVDPSGINIFKYNLN